MSFSSSSIRLAAVLVFVGGMGACVDGVATPTDLALNPHASMSVVGHAPAPPSGLTNVGPLEFWPWTGRDLAGTIADPMNLVFNGDVDLVSLRAALLALGGDRTAFGFPSSYPFDCTWSDAHGEMQPTYTSGSGWVANAIQLQCGSYDPLRFHVRLFDAGDWVVGAVHFDLLIPNTPQHQVISWELPQQLITVDFVRTGLLAAPPAFVPVSPAGFVQAIPKPVYDGIPDPLKVAIGFPPGPTSDPEVPIPSDGVATMLTMAARAPVIAGVAQDEMVLPFNLVIPRPFCSQGPADFVLAQGPVEITVSTRVNAAGILESHNALRGDLEITPVDVSTGMPSGPTFRAQISQIDNTGVGPEGTHVNAVQLRKSLPAGLSFLKTHLVTGPYGSARFTSSEKCE